MEVKLVHVVSYYSHCLKICRYSGARIAPTLSEECTHVLVEPRMQVNEALVNAILAKKPIILTNWVKVCQKIPLSPLVCCLLLGFNFIRLSSFLQRKVSAAKFLETVSEYYLNAFPSYRINSAVTDMRML